MSAYAFATNGAFQASVADWLMRQDLTERIPEFMGLCEVDLDRRLQVKEMVQRRTSTATDQYITLPADWRAARNVQRLPSREPMLYSTLDEIDRYRANILRGVASRPLGGPDRYSILGTVMELAPAPTVDAPAEIEMVYYANVPRMEADTDSSWLLRLYPDVYLYGTLIHSAPFLKDDSRLQVWAGLYEKALSEANASDTRGRYSGAPLRAGGAPTFGV